MVRLYLAIFFMAMFAIPANANALNKSLRPIVRPVGISTYVPRQPNVPVFYHARIRPKPRPNFNFQVRHQPQPIISTQTRPTGTVFVSGGRSLRPKSRPRNIKRIISRAQTSVPVVGSDRRQPKRGSVCGDRKIRGQAIARIQGRISGCGIAHPVKITEVDGVMLSTPATIDCTTAKALKSWVHNGAKPAVGRMGGGIKSLRIVAHYACRNRNNKRGGRLSEHAKGKALDIAAIGLKDGTTITVLKGWRDRRQGPVLKRMHKAACGPFGTVLGPNANKYHQDHFHFDTASYRSSAYCR